MPKINYVEIGKDTVRKVFQQGRNKKKRYWLEVSALKRLADLDGVPALIEYAPDEGTVLLERIPGKPLTEVEAPPDSLFEELRPMVGQVLDHGVAFHSFPARDVIVRPDGSPGLVDFERVTLRRLRCGPIWFAACQVTRFNLLRLIDAYAPTCFPNPITGPWRRASVCARCIIACAHLRSQARGRADDLTADRLGPFHRGSLASPIVAAWRLPSCRLGIFHRSQPFTAGRRANQLFLL